MSTRTGRLWPPPMALLLVICLGLAGCRTGSLPEHPWAPTVVGYLVPWDSRGTIGDGSDVLGEVSPVWYQPTDAADVVFASLDARDAVATVTSGASAAGIAMLPTISNFRAGRWDGDLVHQIITDPRLRARHIAAIVELVRANRWDGVDLDYESLPAAGRGAYGSFVHELAAALHRAQARLSLTVHAKTSEPGGWAGAQAQDWRVLGEAADQIRIMAYDHSWERSAPGPIAPRQWVDQVLQLAVRTMPPERTVIAFGTFGYDWVPGQPGTSLQWADAQAISRARGTPVRWDQTSAAPWFDYTDDGGRRHVVCFEDSRSLASKLELARRYQVAGVALWRLGGEDPGVWAALRAVGG